MKPQESADGKERIRQILARMSALEKQLEDELHRREGEVLYQISNRKIHFQEEVRQAHKRLRFGLSRWLRQSRPGNVASAPVIYSLIVPIAFLDLAITVYQLICFPLYRMPKVDRRRFVIVDRHHLAYLNGIEKLNCVYCGYATGVFAYAREITARTEQYWCPIKHARKTLGVHSRYATFLEYGNAADFHTHQERLRAELERERQAASAAAGPTA